MKIGLDIGGVLSKYPQDFIIFLQHFDKSELFVITDQHPKDKVIKTLKDNGFELLDENIYCADYEQHGNFAKAILIKQLDIKIFIDDFDGYLQWDSSFGEQPIMLKVMADNFKPYWHQNWICEGGDFGRRYYKRGSQLE